MSAQRHACTLPPTPPVIAHPPRSISQKPWRGRQGGHLLHALEQIKELLAVLSIRHAERVEVLPQLELRERARILYPLGAERRNGILETCGGNGARRDLD